MTKELLETREKTHGDYLKVACVSQELKSAIHGGVLSKPQKEAIDMICVKIARIVCGDADFIDHWVDIAGYAELIIYHLEKKKMKHSEKQEMDKRSDW